MLPQVLIIFIALIALIALIASILTFFSGFGPGTILLPAMAIFYPLSIAIVLTGIVHFINGIFKVFLLRKHVNFPILLKFGSLAIPFAFFGAWPLTSLEGRSDLFSYSMFGRQFRVAPLSLIVGLLMNGFTMLEITPRFKNVTFGKKYLPFGGAVSGFFGGLTGHQGAFRSIKRI